MPWSLVASPLPAAAFTAQGTEPAACQVTLAPLIRRVPQSPGQHKAPHGLCSASAPWAPWNCLETQHGLQGLPALPQLHSTPWVGTSGSWHSASTLQPCSDRSPAKDSQNREKATSCPSYWDPSVHAGPISHTLKLQMLVQTSHGCSKVQAREYLNLVHYTVFGITLQLKTFGDSVPRCSVRAVQTHWFPRADLEKALEHKTGRSVQDSDTITLDHPEAETQGHLWFTNHTLFYFYLLFLSYPHRAWRCW